MAGMVRIPDELELADWRRRVVELYADVRRLATSDPAAARDLWRTVREGLFREHPQSPVPVASRPSFRARVFAYDPTLRFELTVEPLVPAMTEANGRPPSVSLPMSAGTSLSFRPVGSVTVPFTPGERRLSLFWMDGYAGGLFLPFRDATNGRTTYGAGRYLLDAAKGADLGVGGGGIGSLIVDFNFAYQPSCAFDPRWSCPLAPLSNRLDIAIRAGERLV
jgi:uncharacterized protein (DUF1684 family)